MPHLGSAWSKYLKTMGGKNRVFGKPGFEGSQMSVKNVDFYPKTSIWGGFGGVLETSGFVCFMDSYLSM